MSRSVDYLTGAEIIVYKSCHEFVDEADWDFMIENITEYLKSEFESLEDCEKWDGRETKIILENGLCEIGVSQYNGLVSISIRAKEEDYNYKWIEPIAKRWIEQIRPKFEKLGELVKIGTFSNGEAMFRRVDNKQLISSKEGICDWA